MIINKFKDISILDVARYCGIWFKESNSSEVKARCPFCGGGQKHKLTASINVNKNLYYCHRCGEGHNAVTLYAKLVGTSTKQAFAELLATLPEVA